MEVLPMVVPAILLGVMGVMLWRDNHRSGVILVRIAATIIVAAVLIILLR